MHRQFRITSCRAMAPAPLGDLLSPNTSRRRARKVVPKVTQISCNSASAGVLHPQYGHVPHWLSAQLIDPPWNLHLCLLGPCFMAQASQASAMLLLQDMPALVAARHNPDLKAKYEAFIGAGKPKKVALSALMRKLIILANTLIRQDRKWTQNTA
jgi:hypothetical protein